MTAKIKAHYRSAGLTPPKGKGIHTEKAHRMVVALMRKGMSQERAWAITMSHLGRSKVVKKKHQRPGYKKPKKRNPIADAFRRS